MNCKKYQEQIEEINVQQELPVATSNHLTGCSACQTFKLEREKLATLINKLQTVSAPADFNSRVNALLRKQIRSAPPIRAWQKFIVLAPTAAAALIFSFVLIKNGAPEQQNVQQNAVAMAPPVIALATPDEQSPAPENLVASQTELPTIVNDNNQRELHNIAAPGKRQSPLANREAKRLPASNLKKEQIFSRDSIVKEVGNSIVPPGFPDPLAAPGKQNGKDLLQTFGIEIVAETENLRVVSIKPDSQGAQTGLETGDVIEKINNQNPAAVSGGEWNEITLTVRRQNQQREIKIVPKP